MCSRVVSFKWYSRDSPRSSRSWVPTVAHETPAATDAAVQAEQIRTLYSQSPAMFAVSPLTATIVAVVFWPTADRRLLIAWVTTITVVVMVRAAVRYRYLRAQPFADETSTWARRLVWGALDTGLLWGLGGALFYDPGAFVPQLLLAFAIGGMVAGASGTFALHLPAFLAFAASAILPVAARMLAEGDVPHIAMGGLAIIYGMAMWLITAHSNRALVESFHLRFDICYIKCDVMQAFTFFFNELCDHPIRVYTFQ